ncbi:MAG: hypothetical protein HW419_3823 [Deltaproteobacteria bacterium]|nr:hypothetical protein [Deltaproteobacteria bacterium]
MKAKLLTEKRAAIDPIDDSPQWAPWTIVPSFGSELEPNLHLPTGLPSWFHDLP